MCPTEGQVRHEVRAEARNYLFLQCCRTHMTRPDFPRFYFYPSFSWLLTALGNVVFLLFIFSSFLSLIVRLIACLPNCACSLSLSSPSPSLSSSSLLPLSSTLFPLLSSLFLCICPYLSSASLPTFSSPSFLFLCLSLAIPLPSLLLCICHLAIHI